jgi:hypothetical protein
MILDTNDKYIITPYEATIASSPLSVEIGGTVPVPFPPTPVIPAWNLQFNGELVGTGRGKWVSSIAYPSSGVVGPTTFTFSDLEGVTGDLFNGQFTSTFAGVSAPNLIFIGNNFATGSPIATWTLLNFPKLQVVGGNLFGSSPTSATINGITSFNLPSLISVGYLNATFPNLTGSVDLSKLRYVTGAGLALSLGGATSLDLSSMSAYQGGFPMTINGANLATITLPTLGTWKMLIANFSSTVNTLNQASVDNLLAALAYMDGTNGTVVYSTARSVTITGTSSAPTNLGSTTTAGSNFAGVGTTCTVNLTSHGYATDDVLRISGITTLTNANRYARITVVNANQFTYTIPSQTATGAGTATIVKAGASAKALVTRGVTLTTN